MTPTDSHSRLILRASLELPPFVAPEGDLESRIAAVFAEVFNLDQVGATDDFLDLGGDSLLAETLALRITERTGQDFPISTLMLQGSPRKIAAILSPSPGDAPSSPARRHLRPPIFMIHARDGYTFFPREFMAVLPADQAMHAFELPGLRGGKSFDRVEDIAAAYVAELEQVYPEGPLLLAAYCYGALIGMEMAVQLAARGRPLQKLLLFDPPNPYKRNKAKQAQFEGKPPDSAVKRPVAPWLHYLPPIGLLDPWRPGTRANDVRSFRRKIEGRRRAGYYGDRSPSISALTRLAVAFEHYEPCVLRVPVAILCSRQWEPKLHSSSYGWTRLLPVREIHVVAERHLELTDPEAARVMCSIFEAVLARDASPARAAE